MELDKIKFSQATSSLTLRNKSDLRTVYEQQARAIEAEIGNLETIQKKLGLSAREICKLLLVDPSAWTRWTRYGAKPPPHIYQALKWYLLSHRELTVKVQPDQQPSVVVKQDSKMNMYLLLSLFFSAASFAGFIYLFLN